MSSVMQWAPAAVPALIIAGLAVSRVRRWIGPPVSSDEAAAFAAYLREQAGWK